MYLNPLCFLIFRSDDEDADSELDELADQLESTTLTTMSDKKERKFSVAVSGANFINKVSGGKWAFINDVTQQRNNIYTGEMNMKRPHSNHF